jgi:hypothetical protein
MKIETPMVNTAVSGVALLVMLASLAIAVPASAADDQTAELAQQLSNPVANLISVPIQYNDDEYGDANLGAEAARVIFQPVVPFELNDDWLLITRTLLPFVDQQGFPLPQLNGSGMGDITASQYFSPKAPTAGGWIWGVGPIESFPTAAEDAFGTGKYSLGVTAVVLKQSGPWTVGYLGAHLWSVGGDDLRPDVDVTTMQPFFSYTTKTYTTVGAYTETLYDWESDQWTVPVIVQVGQMFKVGSQIMQLALGGKYWAEAPVNGPTGWGLRVQLTLLFPN